MTKKKRPNRRHPSEMTENIDECQELDDVIEQMIEQNHNKTVTIKLMSQT